VRNRKKIAVSLLARPWATVVSSSANSTPTPSDR